VAGRSIDSKENFKTVTQRFDVELPSVEFEKPVLDRSRLESIATLTGGRVFDLADAARIADAFPIGRVDQYLEERTELWNAPLWVAIALSAIIGEWLLRKRLQLV
jgi:hypothetical protein